MYRLALVLACLALVPVAPPVAAQDSVAAAEGVTRTVLSERFLSIEQNWMVAVARLEIAPGARIPLHTHPGDEHAVVLSEGRAEMPDGSIMEMRPEMVMYFEAGQVHGGVTNVGDTPIHILTTHVVLANEPFQVPAE